MLCLSLYYSLFSFCFHPFFIFLLTFSSSDLYYSICGVVSFYQVYSLFFFFIYRICIIWLVMCFLLIFRFFPSSVFILYYSIWDELTFNFLSVLKIYCRLLHLQFVFLTFYLFPVPMQRLLIIYLTFRPSWYAPFLGRKCTLPSSRLLCIHALAFCIHWYYLQLPPWSFISESSYIS